jgi:hypothetical protein
MPTNDYDRIVFLMLRILYSDFQNGRETKQEEISAEAFDINEVYWTNIIGEIRKMDLISGASVVRDIHGIKRVKGLSNIQITNDGIHYIKENSTMKKVFETLKEAKAWIPGL